MKKDVTAFRVFYELKLSGITFIYTVDGSFNLESRQTFLDIIRIEPPKEKRKGEFWVNVFAGGDVHSVHASKADAQKYAGTADVEALVGPIKWEEKQGLS